MWLPRFACAVGTTDVVCSQDGGVNTRVDNVPVGAPRGASADTTTKGPR